MRIVYFFNSAVLVQGLMMASPASGYTSSNVNVKNAIIYKPEYTWSYEEGQLCTNDSAEHIQPWR